MKSKLPKYCVYQSYWSEGFRDVAVGDGITSPSRLLIATCDSANEAEKLAKEISDTNSRNTGPLVPGSGRRIAILDWSEFDPLDFVGRQNRDQEQIGKRYAALCGRLYADAARRRDELTRPGNK